MGLVTDCEGQAQFEAVKIIVVNAWLCTCRRVDVCGVTYCMETIVAPFPLFFFCLVCPCGPWAQFMQSEFLGWLVFHHSQSYPQSNWKRKFLNRKYPDDLTTML